MCGVPYHAVNTYVERLIALGHKVAICEQMEDPALAKGLVERDIIRIITPGTFNEGTMLDERSNNYLLSVYFSGDGCGIARVDVGTGEFAVNEFPQAEARLANEVARIAPTEIITNDKVRLRACLNREPDSASEQPASWYQFQNAQEALCRHFRLQDLSPLGLQQEYRLAACAAGALMRYLT